MKNFLLLFLTIICCFLTYNMGISNAIEYFKVSSWLGHDVCNYEQGYCTSYTITQEGSQVIWKERNYSIQANLTNINISGVRR